MPEANNTGPYASRACGRVRLEETVARKGEAQDEQCPVDIAPADRVRLKTTNAGRARVAGLRSAQAALQPKYLRRVTQSSTRNARLYPAQASQSLLLATVTAPDAELILASFLVTRGRWRCHG